MGCMVTSRWAKSYPLEWIEHDPWGLLDGYPPDQTVTLRFKSGKEYHNIDVQYGRKLLWCLIESITEPPKLVLN